MSGLVISLKSNEKFLVNGALLTNGPKRTQLQIGDDVKILRMSDAIRPEEATTPLKRIYYKAQIILSGDAKAQDVETEIQSGLNMLADVFKDTPIEKIIHKAKRAAASERYYSVLCALKPLIGLEKELLSRAISLPAQYNQLQHDAPIAALSA